MLGGQGVRIVEGVKIVEGMRGQGVKIIEGVKNDSKSLRGSRLLYRDQG